MYLSPLTLLSYWAPYFYNILSSRISPHSSLLFVLIGFSHCQIIDRWLTYKEETKETNKNNPSVRTSARTFIRLFDLVCVCVCLPPFSSTMLTTQSDTDEMRRHCEQQNKSKAARVCVLPFLKYRAAIISLFLLFNSCFFFFKNKRKQKIVFYFNKQKNDLIKSSLN